MATDDLTVEMNARGGRETRRELDQTARSARGIGRSFRDAKDDTNLFERALRLLGTRMGTIIILGAVMTVTLGPPMLAALGLLTAAMAALGGVALGVFGVGAAVMLRWKETVNSAGSAAWELKKSFDGIKTAFAKATATGADKVLRAVADAVGLLAPVVLKLAPALNALADSIAFGITIAAHDLVGLVPQMNGLFAAAGPLIEQLAGGVGPLATALMALGTAGIPVLQVLVGWVIDFLTWLGPAIEKVIAWEQDTHTMWNTLKIFGGVVADVADVIGNLGKIVYALADQTAPFWAFIGAAALAGLNAIAGAIEAISNDMETWGPIIMTLVGAFAAYRLAVMVAAAAQAAWNFVVNANPIARVITVIALLVAGLIYAYQHVDWFRAAVDATWQALKSAAHWVAVAAGNIKDAFSSALDWIQPKIEWFVDKITWLNDHIASLLGKLGPVGKAIDVLTPGGDQGLASNAGLLGIPGVPILAEGGVVTRGGSAIVGDQGAEVVHLPKGSAVTPGVGGTETIHVHATLVTPNGEVLARQTLKAARRKQSLT
jgi:hypothetical protein